MNEYKWRSEELHLRRAAFFITVYPIFTISR